ncbi:MAG: T9SS type A sorting domain-containing protein [candidate division Zixibacteria bacterium]|nr:T9SS type A sorting domain-containing protein [candidate division Zixibacteria bacterium]
MTLLFILGAALFRIGPAQPPLSPVLHPAVQKPNEMKLDSVSAAPGQLVSVALSITNERPVGLLFLRLSYDPNFLDFQSATRALRVAGWPIFNEDADTLPGEIHIVGLANDSFPMQPGSGEVGYLNFQVIDQPVPPGTFLPICFVFRKPEDNTMHDSSGALIDSNEIDFVCGSITLTSTGLADEWKNRPNGFELGQNYPNPFNPSTSFSLTLPKAGRYSVRIYNLAGQVVKTFEGEALAGTHILSWDGTDQKGVPVSSGIYFYRAIIGKLMVTKRMVLIR